MRGWPRAPSGVGAEAATANLRADLISYSGAKGLYAGISLEGGVVTPRGVLNAAYCGVTVTLQDILVTRTVTNPHTAPLIEAVTRAATGRRRVAEVR